MDNTKKHISLCTGYGGIDLGLDRIIRDFRTIVYVEIEAFAIVNLVKKIEQGWLDSAPIYSNLKTFPFRKFRGKVDILTGGFPCQPFSSAGKKQGVEDPRHLFPYIEEGIRDLGRPPVVFLENVTGIISTKIGEQSVLKHVLSRLENLDYRATAGIFSACEVGSSHQRKRVFIMGVRQGADIRFKDGGHRCAYPAGRGEEQYEFEPPRIIKPEVGRMSNGCTDRVDIARSYTDYTHNEDELRMLGNGVVPETASKAFRVLYSRLVNTKSEDSK